MLIKHLKKPTYIDDYTPPEYYIDEVNIIFEINDETTRVVSKMRIHKKNKINNSRNLVLDGKNLNLGTILINNRKLKKCSFFVTDNSLIILNTPQKFTLQIETFIKPQLNTSLLGLYKSSGILCTQCEAQGFRRITYYLDRPDVMTCFTTTIIADKALYPVLLSNGKKTHASDMENGKHSVTWYDPSKKPCYLFALVAGDLKFINDEYVTQSGRSIDCRIYAKTHNIDKCSHAINTLKRAMQWDEINYGLEYDLDIYMIVALDDFNMGAMENKGLNIFNSEDILASHDTATDTDYLNIETVISHEYFHNWTGNRVTCRDWFQLTLKEGLTVFRDQQFTSSINSSSVQRIDNINTLRSKQFSEDSGPTSHPVQPRSYMEISNLYTATVYLKGAEIVHMIHTIIGEHKFRKGMDLYFSRHDEMAVTTEDFIKSIEDACNINLTQFRRWYYQSGTPELNVKTTYDNDNKQLLIHLKQSSKSEDNKPFHFPVKLGLIDRDGNEVKGCSQTINITKKEHTIVFDNINDETVVSILRNHSAPVKLNYTQTNKELSLLTLNDSDEFNRWSSAHKLSLNIILSLINNYQNNSSLFLDDILINTFRHLLSDTSLDKSLLARILSLPSEDYISQHMNIVNVDAVHHVREFCKCSLSFKLMNEFERVYEKNNQIEYSLTSDSMGMRSLKNTCLNYMMCNDSITTRESSLKLATKQFQFANNMTDQLAALRCLVNYSKHAGAKSLAEFYQQWRNEPLIIDKWFIVQAKKSGTNSFSHIQSLLEHESFDITSPNRVFSLIGEFSRSNPVEFHHSSGQGYNFLADAVIKLNIINPHLAARLLTPLVHWKKYDHIRQRMMKSQLQRVHQIPNLAGGLFEIIKKALHE